MSDRFPYPPLLADISTVCHMLSLSRSKLNQLRSSGELGPMSKNLGGKILYDVEELRRWSVAGCPNREQWLEQRNK